MVKNRTIVEINGRKYDANTGQIVMDTPTATPVIDGFRAPISSGTATATSTQEVKRAVNSAQNMHARPQRTQKLHPVALKKQVTPKRVNARTTPLSTSAVSDIHKPVMLGRRAKTEPSETQHTKSLRVSRFQRAVDQPVETADETVVDSPDSPAVAQPMQRPAVARPSQKFEPRVMVEQSEKKPGLLKRVSQKRPKLIPATIMTVLVLVAGGYVAYQNIPHMALRVAAQRAGFNASLPGYNPSGFGFSGPVSYSEGVVEVEYRSNSDDRTYKLIQKESTWDSQSLLDNYVTAHSDN